MKLVRSLSVLTCIALALVVQAVPPPNAVYTLTVPRDDGGKAATVKLVTLDYYPRRAEIDGVPAHAEKPVPNGSEGLTVIVGNQDDKGHNQGFAFHLKFGETTITTDRGVTGTWQARDALPFGDRDFYPSPTNAAGFAGQGSNWYPGATPPTEWWEGTPTTVKVMVESRRRRDGYLSLSGPYDKEVSLPGYADDKAKNILWKEATPGWSTSSPIVVGNRVISTHSPHHVVCRDADTGKVIWQDDLKIMALPKLAADRKTLEKAPDAEQAKKLQFVHELGLAVYRLGWACQPGLHKTILTVDDRKALIPLMGEVIKGLEAQRAAVAEAFPEGAVALDAEIDQLKKGMVASAESDLEAGKFRLGAFPAWVQKTTGVPLGNCWPGYQISDTIATPVSDGTVVCVQFGQGQTAAYDVLTGKRLWAFRDPTVQATSVSHAPSPLLWKDTLIVNSGGAPGRKPSLLALDTRTGAVKWETKVGLGGGTFGGSHGDHMPHYLARLTADDGTIKAVVITNQGAVVDAESGKVLIDKLPKPDGGCQQRWAAGFVSGVGNLIVKCEAGDNYGPPAEAWELKVAADGTIEATPRAPLTGFSSGQGPFALSDRVLAIGAARGMQGLVDPTTGKLLGQTPGGTATIAGHYLISASDQVGANGRERKDHMCLASFTVTDIADPTKPKVVAKQNLLGSAAMPTDIMDTFFPAIAKDPELKILTLGGYHGVAPGFGVYMAGVTAQGSRLYILSQSHLYCIGEKE